MTTQATAEEVYDQVVRPLPLSQRLKLATMILNDIPSQAVVDYDEAWSGDDIREFTETSWGHVLRQVEEDEANADTG
jgi:hypothetical protein